MVENTAAPLHSCEVEEAVVGKIDDGRLVGHRGEDYRKLAAAGNAVGNVGLHSARITFLAVGADIGQGEERRGSFAYGRDGPGLAIKTCQPAMQRVGAVIGGQLM